MPVVLFLHELTAPQTAGLENTQLCVNYWSATIAMKWTREEMESSLDPVECGQAAGEDILAAFQLFDLR